MRLSELRRRNTTGGGNVATADQEQGQALGTIRNAVAYTHPIYATYKGEAVTLLATGDIVGMSPACQFVDKDGRIDWASTDEFVVDDRHVLPATTPQTRNNTTIHR